MNRRGYTVVCILLLIVGGVAFFSMRTPIPLPVAPVLPVDLGVDLKGTVTMNPPMIQIYEDRTSDVYVTHDAHYPQFVGIDPAFNAKIKDLIDRAVGEHASTSAKNWQARRETLGQQETVPEFPSEAEKSTFFATWEPKEVSSEVVSFVLRYGGYSGGAHGYENIVTFNYSLTEKEEVALKDLFPNDPEYLETISALAIEQLERDIPMRMETPLNSDMKEAIREGAGPLEQNFANFTFTRNVITFYFGQYQVGPYSIGESVVRIPRPKL